METEKLCIVCNKRIKGHSVFCSKKCLKESVKKDAEMIKRPIKVQPVFESKVHYWEEHKIHHPYIYNYRIWFNQIA